MFTRNQTRSLKVGNVAVGGGAPVSVQTMLAENPHDAAAILSRLESCAASGADIVRLAIPDFESAKTLAEVRRQSPVPLVADIHFDHRLALAAIEAGADALRLNPGNIGGPAKVRAVAVAAAGRGIPIRVGVNLGSLEKPIDARLRAGEIGVAEALCESAIGHIKLLEAEGFRDIVVSVKASDVAGTLDAYRALAERTDCPLHLGLTEAGTFTRGAVHSSVALGALLADGIGDTLRVSLTDVPEKEVKVGLEILRALGMRAPGPGITSCPTCGRTRADVFGVAAAVESALESVWREALDRGLGGSFPHVAVMGCVVNGPGEAKGADIALCGAVGEFVLYRRGVAGERVPEREAPAAVVREVRAFLAEAERRKKER